MCDKELWAGRQGYLLTCWNAGFNAISDKALVSCPEVRRDSASPVETVISTMIHQLLLLLLRLSHSLKSR
jgi:hypothetical protein